MIDSTQNRMILELYHYRFRLMSNYIDWQESTGFEAVNFLPIISIYQKKADIWFLPRMVIIEYGYYYILKSKAI
jgi:hypothetical protein